MSTQKKEKCSQRYCELFADTTLEQLGQKLQAAKGQVSKMNGQAYKV